MRLSESACSVFFAAAADCVLLRNGRHGMCLLGAAVSRMFAADMRCRPVLMLHFSCRSRGRR